VHQRRFAYGIALPAGADGLVFSASVARSAAVIAWGFTGRVFAEGQHLSMRFRRILADQLARVLVSFRWIIRTALSGILASEIITPKIGTLPIHRMKVHIFSNLIEIAANRKGIAVAVPGSIG
jgi:hypothetical protein